MGGKTFPLGLVKQYLEVFHWPFRRQDIRAPMSYR
jgi:hypothetical protein